MRKADRLFRIVEYLKARRGVVQAIDLSQYLSVSLRTIYRDIADLTASGVPIISETGVGYVLDKGHIVKPLMFTLDEIEALAMGAQMVKSFCGPDLHGPITQAMNRLVSALPDQLRQDYENTFLLARNTNKVDPLRISFTDLRGAMRDKSIVKLTYTDLREQTTQRTVRPLCLVFFGQVWVLLAWCESRNNFRSFRLDRIEKALITEKKFRDEKGKRFVDYCDLHGYSKSTG